VLATLLTVFLSGAIVFAETVVINHISRGWYAETGLHVSNGNYLVGDSRGPTCVRCFNDYHNFFVFDLASVTQPIGSAKLRLFLPSQLLGPGYVSPDPGENYALYDVSTPISTLVGGTGGVAAHADLGSGVVYGSRTITAADMGSMVEIDLNTSAIAALDAATGLIGIGGTVTTLDSAANAEYVFGATGLVTHITELRLTLVPEPSTLFLLGIGAISLVGYRRHR
jgi:hypothetical protein